MVLYLHRVSTVASVASTWSVSEMTCRLPTCGQVTIMDVAPLSTKPLGFSTGLAAHLPQAGTNARVSAFQLSGSHRPCIQARLRSLASAALVAISVRHGRLQESLTKARCSRNVPNEEFFEVELDTQQPAAVAEILFGMGAISSSFCERPQQTPRFKVTAQFDHAIDIERCSSILMTALDLQARPALTLRGLGPGTWIDHFPLCEGFEVCLPCHEEARFATGERSSGRARSVVYLEGSTAFGAGPGPCSNMRWHWHLWSVVKYLHGSGTGAEGRDTWEGRSEVIIRPHGVRQDSWKTTYPPVWYWDLLHQATLYHMLGMLRWLGAGLWNRVRCACPVRTEALGYEWEWRCGGWITL